MALASLPKYGRRVCSEARSGQTAQGQKTGGQSVRAPGDPAATAQSKAGALWWVRPDPRGRPAPCTLPPVATGGGAWNLALDRPAPAGLHAGW
jgi:hypothetical protein